MKQGDDAPTKGKKSVTMNLEPGGEAERSSLAFTIGEVRGPGGFDADFAAALSGKLANHHDDSEDEQNDVDDRPRAPQSTRVLSNKDLDRVLADSGDDEVEEAWEPQFVSRAADAGDDHEDDEDEGNLPKAPASTKKLTADEAWTTAQDNNGTSFDINFATQLHRKLDKMAYKQGKDADDSPHRGLLSLHETLATGEFETQIKRKLASDASEEDPVSGGWKAPAPTQGSLPPLGMPLSFDDEGHGLVGTLNGKFEVRLQEALTRLAALADHYPVGEDGQPINPRERLGNLSNDELVKENDQLRREIESLREEVERCRREMGKTST